MPFNSGKYQNLVRKLKVEIVFVYLSFVEIAEVIPFIIVSVLLVENDFFKQYTVGNALACMDHRKNIFVSKNNCKE